MATPALSQIFCGGDAKPQREHFSVRILFNNAGFNFDRNPIPADSLGANGIYVLGLARNTDLIVNRTGTHTIEFTDLQLLDTHPLLDESLVRRISVLLEELFASIKKEPSGGKDVDIDAKLHLASERRKVAIDPAFLARIQEAIDHKDATWRVVSPEV
jgi:hypothetical protein